MLSALLLACPALVREIPGRSLEHIDPISRLSGAGRSHANGAGICPLLPCRGLGGRRRRDVQSGLLTSRFFELSRLSELSPMQGLPLLSLGNAATPLDLVAHIIQVALTPVFLLTGIATLLNV